MSAGKQSDPNLGRLLANQYRIESVLGEGGMGTVYRGVQLSVNRPVAIKLILSSISGSPEHVQRFRREAELMSKLEHPSIVRLYDFGLTDDGLLYLVMELLQGRELSAQLSKHGAMAPERALRLCLRILHALRQPHEQGIVHRDLKPQNIFLTNLDGDEDVVKIMDFGLARLHDSGNRLTRAGEVMGTPAYMAPEQAQGHSIDARADLYAVGIILFVMLTGRIPFESKTAMSMLAKHITEPPPRLKDVAPRLVATHFAWQRVQDLLDRLLAKSPDQRPSTAADAAAMVHVALTESIRFQPTEATPFPPPAAVQREAELPPMRSLAAQTVTSSRAARRSWLIGGAAVAGIAAIAVVAIVATSSGPGQPSTAPVATPAITAEPPRAGEDPETVTIASKPSGAMIFLDGAELGPAPYKFEFRRPTELEVRLEGHLPARLSLVRGGEPTVVVDLSPSTPDAKGTLVKPTATVATNKRVAPKESPGSAPPPPIVSSPAIRGERRPGEPIENAERPKSLPPREVAKPVVAKPAVAKPPVVRAESKPSPAPEKEDPVVARRKQLLKKGPRYNNIADAKKAYLAGSISSEELNDISWVLRQYRSFKQAKAKKDLKAGRITQRQHDEAVSEAERFYREGKR